MDLQIALDTREAQGKANKRLRRAGIVPGVVYGYRTESTAVQLDAKEFETLYRAAGRTSVIKLTVGAARSAKSAVIKSVQRHPLSGNAIHVDFLLVDLAQEMEVNVPLVYVNEAPAVNETGGMLFTNLDSVRVRALPNEIPHEITVDVSTLHSLDVAIHVRDLSLNRDQVTVLTDADELVVKVMPPRVEVEEEPVVAEGEELPEGEAPEGAEGEAPTEGGETESVDTTAEETAG